MSPQSQNRSLLIPLVMVVAGLALIIGSIWWTLNNRSAQAVAWTGPGASPSGVLPAGAPPSGATPAGLPPQPASTRRIPYPHIPRVNPAEAKAAFDGQKAIFIDARGEALFIGEHIPGAIPLIEEEIPQREGEFDKNAWIIPYCT